MKVGETSGQVRLFWGICLGVLACMAWGAEVGRAMTSMDDQHRKKMVQNLYDHYRKCFPEVPEVTPKEAMALVQQDQAVLVDVRPAAERQVSRLPGAISAQEFLNAPDRHKGKTVIAYDTIGYRSGIFVADLKKKEIFIANLREGLLGWLYAGGKLYNDYGETDRVHIYGSLWNYVPPHCEAVR